MKLLLDGASSYHVGPLQDANWWQSISYTVQQYNYSFENFFHPYVGALIRQLNLTDISGMLDPSFLSQLRYKYQPSDYVPGSAPAGDPEILASLEDQDIDVDMPGGPYAGY